MSEKGFDLLIKALTQTHDAVKKYDENLVGQFQTLTEKFNADRTYIMGVSTALKLYLERSEYMLRSETQIRNIYESHVSERRRIGTELDGESLAKEAAAIMMSSAIDSIFKRLESGESISVAMMADGKKLALPSPLDRGSFAKGLREGLNWLTDLAFKDIDNPPPSPLTAPPGYRLN